MDEVMSKKVTSDAAVCGNDVPRAGLPSQRQQRSGVSESAAKRDGQRGVTGSGQSCPPVDAACFMSRTTSPGSAWRPIPFLENTRRPSTSTSNTPPDD